MKNLIKLIQKYNNVITISIISLLIACAFICCLTQVIAKIGMFIGICGIFGTIVPLIISILLLINEIKELKYDK